MIREIRMLGDAVLREKAEPVGEVTDELRRLVADMFETMYAAEGVGLAAPQVGVSQRMSVWDIAHDNPGKQIYKLVNPELTLPEGDGRILHDRRRDAARVRVERIDFHPGLRAVVFIGTTQQTRRQAGVS